MCVIRNNSLENNLPILTSLQPKQMTTPKDSKVDDINTNQADSMKELIATQHQLNQLTAQFIANNSDKDPALQRFLEEQSQLMLKVTNQMISMEENYPKRVYDNKDDKNIVLDGAPDCIICGDKDHTSKEHEGQCPNCEGNHPVGEGGTSQATCYLCEGTDHVHIQCPIDSMVEQRKQEGSKSPKGKGPLIPPNKTAQIKGTKNPK